MASIARQDPDIMKFLTPTDFIAKAYTDYTHNIAEEWSKFHALYVEITSSQPDWFDDDNPTLSSNIMIKQWIADKLLEAGYMYDGDENNYNVILTNGNITKYYWSSIIQYGSSWLSIYDLMLNSRAIIFDKYCLEGVSNWLDLTIPLSSSNGISYDDDLPEHNVSIQDITLTINSILEETTALYAACKSATIENVADRIVAFNDTLSSTFSNVYDAGSKGISYFRGIISTVGATTQNILTTLTSAIGIESRDESTNIFSETDVGKYTGASPVPSIDLSTAKGVIKATGAVIVAGAKKIWSLLSKGFSWVVRKTKQYIINPILSPYDLKKISDSEYYSIDKFSLPQNGLDTIILANLKDKNGLSYPYDVQSKVADAMDNQWFKCETIFGEILIQFHKQISNDLTTGLTADVNIKPYCINPETLSRCAQYPCYYYSNVGLGKFSKVDDKFINYDGHSISFGFDTDHIWPQSTPIDATNSRTMDAMYIRKQDFISFCMALKLAPDLYLDPTEDNEKQMFSGFLTGLCCIVTYLGQSIYMDKETYENSFKGPVYGFNKPALATLNDSLSNPTNKDWFIISTGWANGKALNDNKFGVWSLYNYIQNVSYLHDSQYHFGPTTGTMFVDFFSSLVTNILVYNQFDKAQYPLNYDFVPYAKGTADFNTSRFAIKTDSEVIAEANVVANAIAIVSAVVITTLAGIAIVKLIGSALAKKRIAYRLDIERKLAAGQKVSNIQLWKYKRANRKLNAAGYIGSNLQSLNTSTSLYGNEENDSEMAGNIVTIRDLLN